MADDAGERRVGAVERAAVRMDGSLTPVFERVDARLAEELEAQGAALGRHLASSFGPGED